MKLKAVESVLLALLATLVTGCNSGTAQNNSIKPQDQIFVDQLIFLNMN